MNGWIDVISRFGRNGYPSRREHVKRESGRKLQLRHRTAEPSSHFRAGETIPLPNELPCDNSTCQHTTAKLSTPCRVACSAVSIVLSIYLSLIHSHRKLNDLNLHGKKIEIKKYSRQRVEDLNQRQTQTPLTRIFSSHLADTRES